jgi:cell division protein FtsQ
MNELDRIPWTLDEERPFERPRRRRRWPWAASAAILLGVAGAGASLALSEEPVFTLEKVTLAGTTRLTADEALGLAGLARGMNLLAVDAAGAAARLSALPFVRRAAVSRELPSGVRIEIEERTPAILVALGPLYVADEEGVIWRRLLPGERPTLPILTGLSREDARTPARLAKHVRQALALKQALGDRCVEEIAVRAAGGLCAVLCAGPEVHLGEPPFEGKLSRLARALAARPDARVVYLDDDRPDRVVVRIAREGR